MFKLISKITIFTFMLLGLTACLDKIDRSTSVASNPDTAVPASPTLILGKTYYAASCANCHGDSGEGTWPIKSDACQVADCNSIDTLASYIDQYMPQGDVQGCSLDGDEGCALTTAAYILNGFSTDDADDTDDTDDSENNVQTPLARLTNDEYVNSVRNLLSLPNDSPQINAAKASLISESRVKGLTNDAVTQTLTQLAISGYSTMALAASNDFLNDVTTTEQLGNLLGCSISTEANNSADESPNLLTGKTFYDTSCSSCHGSEGDGSKPIAVNACLEVDCSDVNALATYIGDYMPKSNVQSCALNGDNSCALTTAAYISNNFSTEVEDGTETSTDMNSCIQSFSKKLISRAYRRPSNSDDAVRITEVLDNLTALNKEYIKELADLTAYKTYMRGILHYVMLSPEFLLVVENGRVYSGTAKELTDHEIATRLALFLAGTLPDDALIADANSGLLGNAAVRLQHANRLMSSDTGIEQFTTLVKNWLDIDSSLTSVADSDVLSTFITGWFVNEKPFSELYKGSVAVEHVDGTVSTEPLGVLGLKAFVASHTQFPTPSFITRGVFVVERLLCEALPDGLPDDALDAGELTPLEVFHVHDRQACASCHEVFDNYGAAFQQFDGETSLFNPSDKTFGSNLDLFDIGDVTTPVTSLGDLGYTMASSSRAPSCMAELWYRHSLRRNIDTLGKDDQALQILVNEWSESGGRSMKALLRSIVASDSFVTLFL